LAFKRIYLEKCPIANIQILAVVNTICEQDTGGKAKKVKVVKIGSLFIGEHGQKKLLVLDLVRSLALILSIPPECSNKISKIGKKDEMKSTSVMCQQPTSLLFSL